MYTNIYNIHNAGFEGRQLWLELRNETKKIFFFFSLLKKSLERTTCRGTKITELRLLVSVSRSPSVTNPIVSSSSSVNVVLLQTILVSKKSTEDSSTKDHINESQPKRRHNRAKERLCPRFCSSRSKRKVWFSAFRCLFSFFFYFGKV